MDIYATEGTKVIVTEKSITSGRACVEAHTRKHLNVGEIYTVDHTCVHNSSTDVYLKEVPGETFNSISFEDYSSFK